HAGTSRWALLLLCLSGCGRDPQPREPVVPPTVLAPDAAHAPSPPLHPADQSLTAKEYMSRGLPDPAQPWSAADTVIAEKTLAALTAEIADGLPRFRSNRSGSTFARLIDTRAILASCRDRSQPLQPRIAQAVQSGRALNGIFKLYLDALTAGRVGGEDMVELF